MKKTAFINIYDASNIVKSDHADRRKALARVAQDVMEDIDRKRPW